MTGSYTMLTNPLNFPNQAQSSEISRDLVAKEAEIVAKKQNILIIREVGEQSTRKKSNFGKSKQGESEWEDLSPDVEGILEQERLELVGGYLKHGEKGLMVQMNRKIMELFGKMRDDKWAMQSKLDNQRVKADTYKSKYQVM